MMPLVSRGCFSGHGTVQLGVHDQVFLRSRLVAGADENCGLSPAVHCHVGNVRRNEQIVARVRLLAMLQSSAGPQFYLVAAEEVKGALVLRVDMRLRTLTRR